MKNRYYFLFAFLFLACLYLVFLGINTSRIDVHKVNTDAIVSAEMLIEYFVKDEERANEVYNNKVLEVSGTVKEISFKNNRTTVLLASNYQESSVLCDMQLDLETDIKVDKKVIVKGICKGFLHDVVMLNCVLINIESDE